MRPRTGLIALAVTALLLLGAGSSHAAEGAPGALPPSIRIRPVFVPVVNNDRIEKYNQLEITLELADSTKLAAAQAAMPRLHDAILALVYEAIDQGWIIRGNIANATAFRQRINGVAEEMLGRNVIGRVLITPVSRQSAWP
ncbi:flagellar basal body-associated FliL family protein [Azospirillum halopraeferens]|uniref:flagellar basal body-associated FliL family protein n=1 Tax=Azospirillum halopraeferens TaxID=34010 RepID=UPI0003F519D2|nr:flagellar basal body-associated FliL family protein [Azospirillum halopraeferens]